MKVEKKKLALFIDHLGPGGSQRQLVELARSINREEFDPFVVIYHDIQHYKVELEAVNIPVVLIRKTNKVGIPFLFSLIGFMRREKPDILLSFLNTPNMWGRVAGKLSGIKNIFTSERNIDLQHSRVRMIIEFLLGKYSSHIIVNTEAMKKILIEKVLFCEEKISVIRNGVDIKYFSSPDPKSVASVGNSFGIREGDFVITLPGRIAPQKNHMCLVKAMELFKNAKPTCDMKILFVGNEVDPVLKEDLLRELKVRNLSDYVVFTGSRKDMPTIYALSNVVVLPSLWEGLPNVLLEAMSAKTIIVASDIADNAKLVKNWSNGFLFTSNDHDELARDLVKIYEMTPEEKAGIEERAFLFINENNSSKRMAMQFEDIFRRYYLSPCRNNHQ